MTMASFERVILAEARIKTGNSKLKMKDIMEWSTGDIEAQEGKVLYHLSEVNVNIAVKG
ncbi:hypothetical protein LCGC14_2811660 [marine sediment metagenome]|uniref:Uncharacterized protein n=1 Tax=marine sediment metagenome TaxID=412755 RepID=A0A0F8Z6H6_9ZZZZ